MCKTLVRTIILITLVSLVSACGPAAPTATPVPPTTAPPADTPVPPTAAPPADTPVPPTTTARPTSTPEPTPLPLAPLDGRGGGVIAFTSEREGNADIYVMNADGSGVRRLTDDPAYDAWPVWSPDGSRIAFMSTRSGNPDIYVMDADGGNLRQLTTDPANDIWPDWSPDGTRIAFPSRRDGNFEIYVMDADGGHAKRLTDTPAVEDFPAWSPDGTQIVYSRSEGDDGTYVMNADGSDPRKLMDIVGLEFAWSPDGKRIAFGSDYEWFRGIYVMDAEGNNLQKLTDNRFEDEFPAWRPMTAVESTASTILPDLVARTYGGQQNDAVYDILLLADGGTLIAGRANNTGLSHRITPGNARLIRTDAEGNIIWQKDYGGKDDANFYSLVQVGEDEYVVLGSIAASYERDETDFYLVKVDGEGNEIWSHTYGGRGMDPAKMVRQTADGGFILTGSRADEHPSGGLYQADLILIKTDAEGNKVWTRTYGNRILYLAWGVAQTPDGGYVLTGWEAKTIPDRDVVVIKTDEAGVVEWSRTWDLDPGDRDGGFDLILTSDGYIVIACIQSMDSGVRGAVLIKVDLDGNEIWTKSFGEEGVGNEFWDIMEDTDGGYVMAGATLPGKDPATGEDIRRGLIIKTDPDGQVLWQYVFEGDEYELTHFSSAVVLPDGGYVFVGQAIRKGETYLDMLWLKLTPAGTTVSPTDTAVLPIGTNAPGTEAISVDTVDDLERLHTLRGHNDRVNDLAFSGDGAYLASSCLDKTIKLWDVVNWQEVHAFSMNKAGFNGIAFSPDGRLLASADAIWDVESKQVLHTLERGRSVPGPVAFSPDGSILAVALEGRPIKLWDVASSEVLRTFEEQPDDVTFGLAFSPDGRRLAAGVHGGLVRLWDVERGQIAGTLEHGGESDDVHDLAFSPDGQVLASAGNDDTVRLWDVASGQSVHILRHGNGLYGVAFSPDGRLVASACCDRTVKLWDVASGRQVRSLPHDDEVMAVAFSPDGTLLASGGYDHQVYLWGVPR